MGKRPAAVLTRNARSDRAFTLSRDAKPPHAAAILTTNTISNHTGAAPVCSKGTCMKRSRIFLIALTLSLVFALPAYGSGDLVSDGWTWNEATEEVASTPDTPAMDEPAPDSPTPDSPASDPSVVDAPAPDVPAPDGWTWDEALSVDGWTWDEAASTPSG